MEFCCYKEKLKELEDLIESNMFKDLAKQSEYIKENFQATESHYIDRDNLIIYVKKDNIINFLKFIKEDKNLSFKQLIDLFGADLLGKRNPRFEVIYILLSMKLNNRITIKVALEDGEDIETVTSVFENANWYEREVFDMYGILFDKHPDLRRILTDYGFEGYPLRKDFPLTGYKELRYSEAEKKVIYEPVRLTQEFRNFDFEMPYDIPWDKQNKSDS